MHKYPLINNSNLSIYKRPFFTLIFVKWRKSINYFGGRRSPQRDVTPDLIQYLKSPVNWLLFLFFTTTPPFALSKDLRLLMKREE